MTETTLYLLRHVRSETDLSRPEPEWPLSELGRRQAAALCPVLEQRGISRIVSSPFDRAKATVAPFARASGLPVEIDEDWRERKLKSEFSENWRELLEQSWNDFSLTLSNGESSAGCQERVVTAGRRAVERWPGETILAASHGNAIALFLNHLDPAFGFEAWAAMGNPELYRIRHREGGFRWDREWEVDLAAVREPPPDRD